MLEPRAVAVVGASRDPASIGRRILDALVAAGFQRTGLSGQPGRRRSRRPARLSLRCATCRPASISASSRCRAIGVLGVVDDCAAAGVKSLVVITAGFAEVGDEGRALQQQLVERVRGYGMRMVGPNCMGLLNADPDVRLNASFSPIVPAGGTRRALVAERRARAGDSRARRRARRRPVDVRQRRQQGRRVGQRPARVLGRRPARRASSCCISSRSATRAGSRGSRAASAGPSRSSR